ncbi:protein serine/threonine phosphatase 2C [Trametes maxima]|nr:protein serine/threonine phosphatase 2C [Trametes maxima]
MSHPHDPKESAARSRIHEGCIAENAKVPNVHSVTFQPRGVDKNQDRVVVDRWNLFGHEWLFLAVFDGHLGSTAVEYTSEMLPTCIRRNLRALIHKIGDRLDRDNIIEHETRVTSWLKREIEAFDNYLGNALQRICPSPWDLTEEQARELIEKHEDVIERAFTGTTLALALINLDQRFMWAAGVGDSSVGISTVDNAGKRNTQRLCEIHTFKDPREYYRATMAHPYTEQPLFDWEDRIIGWMNVARAIGDFSLKFHASYLAKLFRFLPDLERFPLDNYIPKIKTPPYIISEPSVRFTDLEHAWKPGTKIMLFTDGVDNLVDGYLVFKPRQHSGANPLDVVAGLLADKIDPEIETLLGHKVTPRWAGIQENRATDVLGNLLGGKDLGRLEMVTDLDYLDNNESPWPFHIDDTSIILWSPAD